MLRIDTSSLPKQQTHHITSHCKLQNIAQEKNIDQLPALKSNCSEHRSSISRPLGISAIGVDRLVIEKKTTKLKSYLLLLHIRSILKSWFPWNLCLQMKKVAYTLLKWYICERLRKCRLDLMNLDPLFANEIVFIRYWKYWVNAPFFQCSLDPTMKGSILGKIVDRSELIWHKLLTIYFQRMSNLLFCFLLQCVSHIWRQGDINIRILRYGICRLFR